jgi:rhamnose transport system substrate-binding protein
MKKYRQFLLILLAITALALASCTGAATPAPEEPAAEAPAATEEPAAEAPAATEEPAAEAPAATEEPAAEAPAATEEPAAEVPAAEAGVKMVLLPKFLGIQVFDQANQGAEEAAAELGNPE